MKSNWINKLFSYGNKNKVQVVLSNSGKSCDHIYIFSFYVSYNDFIIIIFKTSLIEINFSPGMIQYAWDQLT